MRRFARRDSWLVALGVLFVVLLVVTKAIRPTYGAFDLTSLAIAALPVALAAIAQAIVVISGGIDLSVGPMMALTSVTAASLMQDSSEEFAIVVVIAILAMGLVLGIVNGALVVASRVPDIVVTLATSFMWAGAALLVLGTPGGAAADWFKDLSRGPFLVEWLPKAVVLLTVVTALIWVPVARSKLGLSIYAIGSNRLAAFRSGVDVSRTRIAAYALTGVFSAAGGLALTMTTGIGTPIPGPYTLLSVGAIVLGGVSLAGGRGGIIGPIVAVFVLRLIRADFTFLGVDPNFTTVIEGVIMVVVVMIGAFVTLRRRST
ncbi:MAG: ABC transporter permease [Candidatus Limnocylindria bacterium]